MPGRFIIGAEIERLGQEWGSTGWHSRPALTGAEQLAIVEATFLPGKAHAFHRHPYQEEVIYVVEGVVEQWVDRDKKILSPGDSAFIPANMVHASFCVGDKPAKILAIFGPVVGEGSETVEVAHEAPWSTIRS